MLGLKTVGTGKLGSKNCSEELARAILDEVKKERTSSVATAAFFAALYIKGVSDEETCLHNAFAEGVLANADKLVHALDTNAPSWALSYASQLLQGKILSRSEAHELGTFLFPTDLSNVCGDNARAVIATALRMRHTEAEEYAGLLEAIKATINPVFHRAPKMGAPLLQIADPFDGMDRSLITTPLLASHFIDLGYRVVTMVGLCSGPKYGLTPMDLVDALKLPTIKNSQELNLSQPKLGFYAHQDDLSPSVARWVGLRRQFVRRPFLATLEKYLNPWNCDVFVGSAFHHGFSDKMIETAELSGIPVAIITFKGIEGSLGLSLARTSLIVRTLKKQDGSYDRKTYEMKPEDFGFTPHADQKEPPSVKANAQLVEDFLKRGSSGDSYFDTRVRYARAVYTKVLSEVPKSLLGSA